MKFVAKGMIEMKKHEFNAKGMACPLPVVQTKKLLAEYDVVETTVDNFIATENLTKLAEQLKYCIVVASALPLLAAYPFLQKYFAKGVTIGAVKG